LNAGLITRGRTTTVARVIPPRPDAVYGAHSAMCGIFGIHFSSDRATDRQLARELAISLLHDSKPRGREAVEVAIHDGEQIHVLEQAGSVRWPSIREYAQLLGFSAAEEAPQIINAAPKLYW
jgi:hypothetical protein